MSFLPDGYGYVFAALGASFIAEMYLMIGVASRRRKFGISYPALYATEKHVNKKCTARNVEEFNCAQRAHQNTLEHIHSIRLLAVLNGLLQPVYAALLLTVYSVGRFLYGQGYSRNGPEGRQVGGAITHLGDIPLWLMTFYHAAKLLGHL